MIQLSSKGQTLFLVGYAFLVTEVFTWVMLYHVAPSVRLDYPDLPASTLVLLGNIPMLFGSACVFLIAKQTLQPFKFDRAVFLTLVVGLGANYAVICLMKPLFAGGRHFNFDQWELYSAYLYLFVMIGFGPVVEELLMRGCFFEVLRQSWGDWRALRMSTLLFVIPHLIWSGPVFLNPVAIFSLIVASVLFTYLYIEGGLVPAIAAHMFWNFYVNFLS